MGVYGKCHLNIIINNSEDENYIFSVFFPIDDDYYMK
jgi:hypothetical protein